MSKNDMEIVAIITARGNSKGIPSKNIIELNGKPLIAWSIIAAKQSTNISRVIVSTDNKKIADVPLKYGAEVPFLRPSELAQDDTLGMAVVLHAIKWLFDEESYSPDFTMLLQPTSPLRNSTDIENAISILNNKNTSSVVSVSQVKQHPHLMVNIKNNGTMKCLAELSMGSGNRHEYPAVYALNGAIYITNTEDVLKNETWYDKDSKAYIMPEERSIDIDSPKDLVVADYYMKNTKV